MNEVMTFIFNAVLTVFTKGAEWLKELFLPTLNILPELNKGIFPFLGVEDVINSSVLYAAILFLASAIGIYISIRKRKKIWTFACGIVEIFSTVSLISSK